MNPVDFDAIAKFDDKKHIYLTVVKGKDGKEHLDTVKRNIFGRAWMKLGFSSSSMKKVAAYIDNISLTNNDIEQIRKNDGYLKGLEKFSSCLGHYNANPRLFASTPIDPFLFKKNFLF